MRRKILIILFASILALLIGAYIFMRSPFFMGRVHLVMESTLEKRLKREVSIEGVTGNIFRNIDIAGLSIAKRDRLSDGEFIQIEKIRAGYSLLSLLRWRFTIKSIEIIRPRVWLERDEEGNLNIPELGSSEDKNADKKSRFSVLVSQIDMTSGEVTFDDSLNSIHSTISGINGKLKGTGGATDYSGEFRAQSMDISVRGVPRTISDLTASFETSERGITLSDLQLTSGKSHLQASAEMLNGVPTLVSAEIRSTLFLKDIAEFLATPGAAAPPRLDGTAEIYVAISGKLPDIDGACMVSVPIMKVNDLEIRNVDAEAKFTPSSVDLTHLSADLTDGGAELSGAVQLDDGKVTKYNAALKMANLDINGIMAGLNGTDAAVSGHLSGEVSAAGTEPRPGKVDVDGRITVMDTEWKRAESTTIPVGKVEARLSVKGESIVLDVFREKAHAELKGKLSDDGGLDLLAEVDIPDAGEIASLLMDSPAITGGGHISAEASMKITQSGFRSSMGLPQVDPGSGVIQGMADLRGQVDVNMPDLRLTMESDGEEVQIGSLTGAMHLVDDHISVDEMLLRLNESKFRLAAEVQLVEDGKHQVDAILTMDSLLVENYAPLVVGPSQGLPIRISGGLLNGNLGVHGDITDMDGGGEISVTDLLVGERSIEQITLPLEIASNVLDVPNLVVSSLGEQIAASCRFTPAGDYSLKVDSSLVDLSRFSPDNLSVSGTAQISLSGSGNTSSPSLGGRLDLKNLRYKGEDFGTGGLDFTLKDERVHVDASMSDQSLIATLDSSTKPPFPFSGIIQVGNMNLEPALNLAGLGEKADLRIAGSVDVYGEAVDPINSTVDAVFQTVILDTQGYRWRNDGTIEFGFVGGNVRIDSLKMKGAGGEFSADGELDIAGAMDLNATVEGLDLAVVSTFMELPAPVGGRLDCKLSLDGEVSVPILEVKLDASEVAYQQLIIDEISALISYKSGMLEVEEATLKAFGGKAGLKAMIPIELDLMNPPTPDQIADSSVYASLDVEDIDLSFIPAVAPEVLEAGGELGDAHLEIIGMLRQPTIGGLLTLKDGRFQLKALPVPVEDANGSLSLTSGDVDKDSGLMEYGASMNVGWKMEGGKYDARFSIADAGALALNTWHQLLGIESYAPGVKKPGFQLDLEIRNGKLGAFIKAMPATNIPPIDGSFSGEAHFSGEIGEWVSEPVDLFTAMKLPLRGDAAINSLNLAIDGHKIKNRGKAQILLANGNLEMSGLELLTMPPSVSNASEFGSAALSGRIGADETFQITVSGKRLHPGLFASLADTTRLDSGELAFDVKASGRLDSPLIAFSIEAKDLALPLSSINGTTQVDRFRCEMSYEDELLRIEELHVDSFDNQLDVNGAIPVRISMIPTVLEPLDQEMDVKLVTKKLDLAFLSYLSDKIKAVSGVAEADVRMSGSPISPLLAGSFQLQNTGFQLMIDRPGLAQKEERPEPGSLNIENVNMTISIEEGGDVTGNASLKIGEGQYKASGKVELGEKFRPELFDLTFEASPASIDPFVSLATPDDPPPVSGEISISGELAGDARDFQNKPVLDILRTISGDVRVPQNGVRINAAEHSITNPKQILAEFQNGQLDLRSLRLVDEAAGSDRSSSIAAFGSWDIDGDKSFDATLSLDMGLVSRLIGKEDLMSGWLAFKLEARGRDVQILWPPPGASNGYGFTVGHAVIDRFQGRLTYRDQEIQVEQVRISADENQAVFSGRIPMNGKNMDLRFDARLDDMGILSFINRDITESSGSGEMGATITGDMRKVIAKTEPIQFAGSCRFSDLDVNFYEANINFQDIEADVEFKFGQTEPINRGFIEIKGFRGKMNDGEFALNKSRALQPGAEILWGKETGYRIGELRDISIGMVNCSLSQPMIFSILFGGDLVLKGRFDAPIITGDITITKGNYTESLEGFAQRLFSSREIGFKAFLDYPLVQDLELDVNVQVPGDMFMSNAIVEAEAKAFARVSGSLAKPIVAAQGNVVAGKFSYFGREFTITEGEVTNKAEINPEYKIKAETTITNTEDIDIDMPQGSVLKIQMELKGSLSNPMPPDFNISGGGVAQSQQNLDRTDIMSILTLGVTSDAFLDKGLSGSSPLLMEPARWYLEKRAEKLLDLKEFQIQYDPNASKETRLVIAKEIMKQISLLMDVGYGGQQWIGLQREMSKHFAFDGKVSQYGDWSLDLKIKRDFP